MRASNVTEPTCVNWQRMTLHCDVKYQLHHRGGRLSKRFIGAVEMLVLFEPITDEDSATNSILVDVKGRKIRSFSGQRLAYTFELMRNVAKCDCKFIGGRGAPARFWLSASSLYS